MNSTSTRLVGLFLTPLLALSGIGAIANAQVTTLQGGMVASAPCPTFSHNLYMGIRDQIVSGEVTSLQSFLVAQGYLSVAPTGYFGPLTMRAVINFQRDNGVSTTGFVGMQTRAHIVGKYCNTMPPSSNLQINSITPYSAAVGTSVTLRGSGFTSDNTILMGSGALVHVVSYDGNTLSFTVPAYLTPLCHYSTPACEIASRQTSPGNYTVSVQNANGTSNALSLAVTDGTPTSNVIIYSISPMSGPTGTTVSITGFGFTGSNTVHLGGGAIGNVPISSSIAIACTTSPTCHGGINQTLTITIPSSIGPYCPPGSMCPMYMQLLSPGVYSIYVQNDNGTSNPVSFTVTGASSNQAPTISGLDAPATLALGSTGTWSVHAAANAGSTTNLHYSVNWGDQQVFAASGIMASPATSLQSSATFTHAYSQAGTYTATFTVSDDNSNSSTVSSTITVTPLY